MKEKFAGDFKRFFIVLNRPPAFPLGNPVTPEQNPYNFNFNEAASSSTVILFDGLPMNNNNTSPSNNNPVPLPSTSGCFVRQPRVKRKSESDDLMYVNFLRISSQLLMHYLLQSVKAFHFGRENGSTHERTSFVGQLSAAQYQPRRERDR